MSPSIRRLLAGRVAVALVVVLTLAAVALAGLVDSSPSSRSLLREQNVVGVIGEHTTTAVGAHPDVLAGECRARAPGYDLPASGSCVAAETSTGAESAANGARLNEQLRLTEEYGSGGVRELPDGRMRFYGEETPARTPGEMSGGRLVREWDPARDIQRTWYETLDQEGNIRIVRPETGGPKVHYMFGSDGTYQGSW